VQTAPADYPTIRPHRLGVGFYASRAALVRTTTSSSTSTATSPRCPSSSGAQPDLVLLNDEDLAYAKIRLDERSLTTAIATSPTSATRSPARSCGARPGTRRGMPRRRHPTTSTSSWQHRRRDRVDDVRTTLAQLQLAANAYVAPTSARPRGAVADGLWALAQAPRRAATASCSSSRLRERAATPEQWDGARAARRRADAAGTRDRRRPRGRCSCRWQPAASSAEQIDAALAADNTAKGGEFAAQAKAALPTVEAKRAAWASLVDSADLPNTVVRSSALGFVHPAGVAALDRSSSRTSTCCCRSGSRGPTRSRTTSSRGCIPRRSPPALRDATRSGSPPTEAPAALRRLVNENLAGVERALAVQERDADS
jgi:aminopeptidase N